MKCAESVKSSKSVTQDSEVQEQTRKDLLFICFLTIPDKNPFGILICPNNCWNPPGQGVFAFLVKINDLVLPYRPPNPQYCLLGSFPTSQPIESCFLEVNETKFSLFFQIGHGRDACSGGVRILGSWTSSPILGYFDVVSLFLRGWPRIRRGHTIQH